MSLIRAKGKMLYRSSLHGAVREASTAILGYKGFVSLSQRTRAFWSMDPAKSAREARYAEDAISRMTEKAIREMIRSWIKGHNYDVDSLCAAGIEIRFEFHSSPATMEECVDVLAEMYAIVPNYPVEFTNLDVADFDRGGIGRVY